MTSLPAEGSGRPVPPLPSTRDWLDSTREAWRNAWESPMAVVYVDADMAGLLRWIRLVEETTSNDVDPKKAAEARQLESAYGMSPLARRRLQWEIKSAEAAAAEDDVASSTPAAATHRDPRLELLDGGA